MGSPLRILHVVVNMNRGGAETLIMNLYRNIDRAKVQFDFLTCKEGVFDAEITEMGGRIHRIPYISDVGFFKYLDRLNKFFKENNNYKVIHSHMDKMSGLILRQAKKAGIPIRISHSHNTSSEGGVPSKVFKWYAGNYISRNATNLFACSHDAAKWLFKGKSLETVILKNGIDCNTFIYSEIVRKEVRKELNLDKNTFVLGHVGRFSLQKNHKFLIELFSKFNKVKPNSVLLLVGDGPLRADIEEQLVKLKVRDKVMFMGIRHDINRILQALDVFVFPSLHEGLPVSLIEAQVAGVPCVISANISPEVDLGCQLMVPLSLSEQSKWVQELLTIAKIKTKRKINLANIAEKGYDIRETAESIEEFYLQISG